MARGVRQGCPASGFLLAMAFDPIFRWLQDSMTPKNPDNMEFLQPAQCAYADDLTALALALRSVDSIAGLNLNYRKCCWVKYGTEGRDSLQTWISGNCDEFCEMQSRKCIFNNFFSLEISVLERRPSRPRYVPVVTFPRKICSGSKKWRWSNQWTIFGRRSQLEGVDSRILRCLMRDAKIASALEKIIMNLCFKKKVSLEEQDAQLEDRFPSGR